MPATTEQVVPVNEVINTLAEDLVLKHQHNYRNNTINNRAFAFLEDTLVEVVRRGEKSTRVRTDLMRNGESFKVQNTQLLGYSHMDGKE